MPQFIFSVYCKTFMRLIRCFIQQPKHTKQFIVVKERGFILCVTDYRIAPGNLFYYVINPACAFEIYRKNLTLYLCWFSFFLPSRLVACDEIIFSLMTKSNAESGFNLKPRRR